MKCVFHCVSNSSTFFALVDVDKEIIKKRRDIFNKLKEDDLNLLKISYFDFSVVWRESSFEDLSEHLYLSDKEVDALSHNDMVEVSDYVNIPKNVATELDQMEVYADRVNWTMILRHTNIEVFTGSLKFNKIGL